MQVDWLIMGNNEMVTFRINISDNLNTLLYNCPKNYWILKLQPTYPKSHSARMLPSLAVAVVGVESPAKSVQSVTIIQEEDGEGVIAVHVNTGVIPKVFSCRKSLTL